MIWGAGLGGTCHYFRSLGHNVTGLDGSKQFVAMARAYSGCEVLHQDFLAMDLPNGRFDGVFANASLFHVPSRVLPRALVELSAALKPRGVLFSSNPKGDNVEGMSGDRYGCSSIWTLGGPTCGAPGSSELGHYFRPRGCRGTGSLGLLPFGKDLRRRDGDRSK